MLLCNHYADQLPRISRELAHAGAFGDGCLPARVLVELTEPPGYSDFAIHRLCQEWGEEGSWLAKQACPMHLQ